MTFYVVLNYGKNKFNKKFVKYGSGYYAKRRIMGIMRTIKFCDRLIAKEVSFY